MSSTRLSGQHGLGDEYEAAWEEWETSGEAAAWDAVGRDDQTTPL